MIVIQSPRLQLSQFQMVDAPEVFACITPAIAKFMPWKPPSWSEYVTRCEKRAQSPEPHNFSFVIRRRDNRECLGMASLEDADSVSPELGLWLKESAHGQGFGREVVAALVASVSLRYAARIRHNSDSSIADISPADIRGVAIDTYLAETPACDWLTELDAIR